MMYFILIWLVMQTLQCSYLSPKDTSDVYEQISNSGNYISDLEYSTSLNFIQSVLVSLYMILISEFGDKTFFIAAIMSIRHSRLIVFLGAMWANLSMIVLSAVLGMTTNIIPKKMIFYLSGILFFAFGLKMMKDAYEMSPSESQEEYEEVQAELRKRESDYVLLNQINKKPPVAQLGDRSRIVTFVSTKFQRFQKGLYVIFSKVFVEAFVLTFLAEWGDRSQMTTIVLAATKDVVGVIVGGTLGHGLCTGIAVISGRFISQKIPIRALTFIGGVTFLLFAVHTFISDPLSNS